MINSEKIMFKQMSFPLFFFPGNSIRTIGISWELQISQVFAQKPTNFKTENFFRCFHSKFSAKTWWGSKTRRQKRPGLNFFFDIRRYFSRVTGSSAGTTVILLKTVRPRFGRNFVENWSWPPLFLNEKPFFSAGSPQKKPPVKLFDTDADKGVLQYLIWLENTQSLADKPIISLQPHLFFHFLLSPYGSWFLWSSLYSDWW